MKVETSETIPETEVPHHPHLFVEITRFKAQHIAACKSRHRHPSLHEEEFSASRTLWNLLQEAFLLPLLLSQMLQLPIHFPSKTSFTFTSGYIAQRADCLSILAKIHSTEQPVVTSRGHSFQTPSSTSRVRNTRPHHKHRIRHLRQAEKLHRQNTVKSVGNITIRICRTPRFRPSSVHRSYEERIHLCILGIKALCRTPITAAIVVIRALCHFRSDK